jgi:hypothetical protein
MPALNVHPTASALNKNFHAKKGILRPENGLVIKFIP